MKPGRNMNLPNSPRLADEFAKAMHLALIVADRSGTIRFANPAFCDMFGYLPENIIGQPLTRIIPERMRGAHTAGMSNVAGGSTPGLAGRAVEVSAIKSDGSEFPIEITLATWSEQGQFWAGGTIRDISAARAGCAVDAPCLARHFDRAAQPARIHERSG
jgi:PAS domain S-box-containing protein